MSRNFREYRIRRRSATSKTRERREGFEPPGRCQCHGVTIGAGRNGCLTLHSAKQEFREGVDGYVTDGMRRDLQVAIDQYGPVKVMDRRPRTASDIAMRYCI